MEDNTMKRTLVGIIALVIALSLTGCATTMALNKAVWKDPGVKIGVAVAKLPRAGTFKAGSQGLLDVVINEAAASGLDKSLLDTDVSAFLAVREKMAAKITDNGLEPILIEDLIDISALPKKKNAKTGTTSTDFGSLKEQYGIDYVLLLNVSSVGTWRNYYGFVPIGDPKAICVGHGLLVKIDDSSKQWEYATDYKKSMVKIDGKWNQPPDYPNVHAAIQTAIKNAVDDLVKNFK
jgi:hypothetical protein